MQFIFTLTNNTFDPDFDLDVKYKHWPRKVKQTFLCKLLLLILVETMNLSIVFVSYICELI